MRPHWVQILELVGDAEELEGALLEPSLLGVVLEADLGALDLHGVASERGQVLQQRAEAVQGLTLFTPFPSDLASGRGGAEHRRHDGGPHDLGALRL